MAKHILFNRNQLPSTKVVVSAAASAAGATMLLRSLAREFLPRELQNHLLSKLKTFIRSLSSDLTLVINEYNNLNHDHLFKAAQLYLEPIIPPNTQRLKVSMPRREAKVSVSLEKDQEIIDSFNGVTLKWRLVTKTDSSSRETYYSYDRERVVHKPKNRFFELSFHKKHKQMVFDDYIPHVIEKAKELKEKRKTLKLYTLRRNRFQESKSETWQSVHLDHPATFGSLAMDIEAKKVIMEDLERFVKRKEFYRRVGKVWKRGYLLFGPPGTGKSSLIAAMANYLNFSIYDLELTDLKRNSDLRRLLTSTANKSILVVEDIDCSIELQERPPRARPTGPLLDPAYDPGTQVTLSGLLNFIDGLWSSCGDERIIVFTTNNKEKLDPALLRPGRMDVHIHMSYCTPCGFKTLASNYLGMTEHPLILEVEELLEITQVTPAEIGEQLMKSEEPEIALRGLLEFLELKREDDERKKRESQESKVGSQESEAAEASDAHKPEKNNGEIVTNEATKKE